MGFKQYRSGKKKKRRVDRTTDRKETFSFYFSLPYQHQAGLDSIVNCPPYSVGPNIFTVVFPLPQTDQSCNFGEFVGASKAVKSFHSEIKATRVRLERKSCL